jgi:uncharacterized protein YukE
MIDPIAPRTRASQLPPDGISPDRLKAVRLGGRMQSVTRHLGSIWRGHVARQSHRSMQQLVLAMDDRLRRDIGLGPSGFNDAMRELQGRLAVWRLGA